MDAAREIETLVRARFPILYVVSWEERRVEQVLGGIAKTLNRQLHVWSVTKGMRPATQPAGRTPGERLPSELAVLTEIHEAPEGKIFLLRDFHQFLRQNSQNYAAVTRLLRDLSERLRGSSQTLVILGPTLNLPVELEKDCSVIEFPLPTRQEIEAKLNDVAQTVKENEALDTNLDPEDREALIKSAQGLTLDEVESCLARSLVQHRKFSLDVMLEEKKQIIRKSGLLDFYAANSSLADVGGHELLKDWLHRRRDAFTDKAKDFGIPVPKGVLMLGVQGCGKSLVAKSISANWNQPLLKLDMGRIFGSYVGQSEENMRRAIRVAESVAPCILWIDELEKGLGGVTGSNDSGATLRVFATFLAWMQDKTHPVFIVATANNVSALPPELLRKGRFDDIFFIDLPDRAERADIFRIHLSRRKRDPQNFNLERMAELSAGFSGAEIEQVVVGSLYLAFDKGRDLTQEDLEEECKAQVPLSRTMSEEITALREWARHRARPSSKFEE